MARTLRMQFPVPNFINPSGSVPQKIIATGLLVLVVLVISAVLRSSLGAVFRARGNDRERFWADQAIGLAALAAIVAGIAGLWARDIGNMGGVLGLIAAGVAVALQRVITSFAGYLIILRGRVFTVGDRITIGGVRGDVVALGFMQTTVLEMGQSPPEQPEDPAVWVRGRQYTGRMVRVTNDKIFETPVYNYTREFPYVWDEIMIPIHHGADRRNAEEILLNAARARTGELVAEAKPCLEKLRREYYINGEIELEPRVYLTITDNWLEMSMRFVSREPGVRILKDALFRDIIAGFERAGITIASSSSEVSVVTPLVVRNASSD